MITIKRNPTRTRLINNCKKYILEDETYLMTNNNCYLNGEYYGRIVKCINNTYKVLLETDDPETKGALVKVSFV